MDRWVLKSPVMAMNAGADGDRTIHPSIILPLVQSRLPRHPTDSLPLLDG